MYLNLHQLEVHPAVVAEIDGEAVRRTRHTRREGEPCHRGSLYWVIHGLANRLAEPVFIRIGLAVNVAEDGEAFKKRNADRKHRSDKL